MSLEANSNNSIQNLNTNNPTNFDLINEGDDHIRMIKAVLKTTFPLIDKPLTATSDGINKIGANITAADTSVTFQQAVNGTVGTTWNLNGAALTGVKTSTAATTAKTSTDAVNIAALFKYAPYACFPVGAIYLTLTNTNPKTLLGMTDASTTWTLVSQGRALTGVGSATVDGVALNVAAGQPQASVDGKFAATIDPSNMPRHNHGIGGQAIDIDPNGAHNHMIVGDDGLGSWLRGAPGMPAINYDARSHGGNGRWYLTSDVGNHSHTGRIPNGARTSMEGGTTKLNITQPYFGVYVWQRTA